MCGNNVKSKVERYIMLVLFLLFLCPSVDASVVTSPFGWRVHPIDGQYKFHAGMDIGMDYNEPIGAVMDGVVVFAGVYGGYGNCVIVSHGKDYTLYAHMNSIACGQGQSVSRGTLLGYAGSTGYSTGPHLHLEWWHDGQYCDPAHLLNGTYVAEKPIDYGSIGYPEPKKKDGFIKEKPIKKKVVETQRQELTAKDYLANAARRRRKGRQDDVLSTKLRRKAAFVKAGVGVDKTPVVKEAVRQTVNGFSF